MSLNLHKPAHACSHRSPNLCECPNFAAAAPRVSTATHKVTVLPKNVLAGKRALKTIRYKENLLKSQAAGACLRDCEYACMRCAGRIGHRTSGRKSGARSARRLTRTTPTAGRLPAPAPPHAPPHPRTSSLVTHVLALVHNIHSKRNQHFGRQGRGVEGVGVPVPRSHARSWRELASLSLDHMLDHGRRLRLAELCMP
jgi:hypothetical protein